MGDNTTRQILLTTGFKGGKKLIREDESKAMGRLECSQQKGEIPVKCILFWMKWKEWQEYQIRVWDFTAGNLHLG